MHHPYLRAMLSVLFFAALMRTIQLTQGEIDKCEMPQPWAQTAVLRCVYAVLAQGAIVLFIRALTHESVVSLRSARQRSAGRRSRGPGGAGPCGGLPGCHWGVVW